MIVDLFAGGDLEQFAVGVLEDDAARRRIDRFNRRGDLGFDDAGELAWADEADRVSARLLRRGGEREKHECCGSECAANFHDVFSVVDSGAAAGADR